MRILGPELRRGTGTQNSCQVARAHRDCWRGSEYGNETWGPESVLCGLLLVVWWGLGLVSTIEICTHQDSRMSDGRRTRPACHYCQNVQSSVGGEIKHWVSLNNHKLVLRNAVGYPIDPFPMNISEYVSGRSNIETKHIQGLYLLGIDAIQLGVQSGATEVTAGGSIHCGVIRFLFTIQNTGSPLSPPRVRNVLHRSALGVFAKAKIKYFEFLTQYSSRRSRVKSDRR